MFGINLGPLDDFVSSLPVVGGFVTSHDEENMQNEYGKNQALWQKLLADYQGPEKDPRYNELMADMANASKGGLTPADRAAMLEARSQAEQMAHGREGALEQASMMRGGGVANSGQLLAAQQQAAQAGAQRSQSAGMHQAGIASQRAMQARMNYLDTVARNSASLNNYRMNATSGMTGANTQMGNMYGARDASRKAGMQHWIDTGVNVAMGKGAPPASEQYQGEQGYASRPSYRDYDEQGV